MSSENIYYVYMYIDPNTFIPFYVGMGKCQRAYSHLKEANLFLTTGKKSNSRKLNKIVKLIRKGQEPIIHFYVVDVSRNTASYVESSLIRKYGRIDNNSGVLCNMTDGGDGGATTTNRIWIHLKENPDIGKMIPNTSEIPKGWEIGRPTKHLMMSGNSGMKIYYNPETEEEKCMFECPKGWVAGSLKQRGLRTNTKNGAYQKKWIMNDELKQYSYTTLKELPSGWRFGHPDWKYNKTNMLIWRKVDIV